MHVQCAFSRSFIHTERCFKCKPICWGVNAMYCSVISCYTPIQGPCSGSMNLHKQRCFSSLPFNVCCCFCPQVLLTNLCLPNWQVSYSHIKKVYYSFITMCQTVIHPFVKPWKKWPVSVSSLLLTTWATNPQLRFCQKTQTAPKTPDIMTSPDIQTSLDIQSNI